MHTAALQIGHVNVAGFKAGQREGVSHFHMRVDALLTQDGHARPRERRRWRFGAEGRRRREDFGKLLWQDHMQAGVVWIAHARVFGVSALRVVALLADFPAHSVPHLMQVLQ